MVTDGLLAKANRLVANQELAALRADLTASDKLDRSAPLGQQTAQQIDRGSRSRIDHDFAERSIGPRCARKTL